MDELEKLDNDFNTLTIDVRSNIQCEVDSKAKSGWNIQYNIHKILKLLKSTFLQFKPLTSFLMLLDLTTIFSTATL